MSEVKKALQDCFTSQTGDYDPARVFGYGIAVLGGLVYLFLSVYFALKDGKFDQVQYVTGLVGVITAIVGAAAGVYVKRSTENQPPPPDNKTP